MTSIESVSACADGISFVPIRGRALSHGFHLARRRTWGPEVPWSIVFVYVMDDGAGTKRGVFEAGSIEPDDPRQWVFRSRVMGLDRLPAALPPHPRVQLADVVH